MRHNKMQREVLRLSKSLPRLTSWDIDDMYLCELELEIIDDYSYNSSYYRNGHRQTGFRYANETWRTYVLIDACEGWEVRRYAKVLCRKRSLNAFPTYKVREVAQMWRKDGMEHVLKMVAKSPLSDYYVFWNHRTRMTFREDNALPIHVEDCDIMFGKDMEVISMIPSASAVYKLTKKDNWARLVVTDDDSYLRHVAEYLAKTGQKRMLEYYFCKNHKEVNEFFDSIKVAHKHGYQFRNIGKWFEMMHILAYLELDLRNPFYICPKNLSEALKVMRRRKARKEARIAEMRRIEDMKRLVKQAEEYRTAMSRYLDITFMSTDKTIKFYVLQTPADFMAEGRLFKNCIGGYYKLHDSLCMVAVDVKTGRHLANVEISLKDFSIRQCYAPCNQISRHDKVLRATLNANMDLIRNAA